MNETGNEEKWMRKKKNKLEWVLNEWKLKKKKTNDNHEEELKERNNETEKENEKEDWKRWMKFNMKH